MSYTTCQLLHVGDCRHPFVEPVLPLRASSVAYLPATTVARRFLLRCYFAMHKATNMGGPLRHARTVGSVAREPGEEGRGVPQPSSPAAPACATMLEWTGLSGLDHSNCSS
jgi:hypothetical protein